MAGSPGAGDEVGSVGLTSRTSGGAWTLTDEYATGSASGSWLVPFSGDPPVAVEMVTPTGTVWAHALTRATF